MVQRRRSVKKLGLGLEASGKGQPRAPEGILRMPERMKTDSLGYRSCAGGEGWIRRRPTRCRVASRERDDSKGREGSMRVSDSLLAGEMVTEHAR